MQTDSSENRTQSITKINTQRHVSWTPSRATRKLSTRLEERIKGGPDAEASRRLFHLGLLRLALPQVPCRDEAGNAY